MFHTAARLGLRVALFGAIALLAWHSAAAMPSAQAQSGTSASDAGPIPANGRFAGSVAPKSQSWFRFAYLGGEQEVTITITYLPAESPRTDLVIYTGSAQAPRPESRPADRADNTLSQTFSDQNARDAFVQVVNDHQDRSVSFVGRITPTSALEGPPLGTAIPPLGPGAETPDIALDVQADGSFVGVLAPQQIVWYRSYYGASGFTSTINAVFAPSAGNARLDVYTGPDVGHLTQQSDTAAATNGGLMRQVSLPSPQWLYFTVSNSSPSAQLAYVGQLTPVFVPPVVQPTQTVVVLPTPTPVPAPTPQPAPGMVHDQRFFAETRFRIDDDAIWGYFQQRGQLDTFGFPVSRTFTFLGCPVQIFQRQVVQICPGRTPTLLNLLDPEIFPYSRVNGSIFPEVDESLKAATPRVGDPNYATAILEFMRANAPESVQLDLWGAPISRPRPDPNNADFIYQRFQRAILHQIISQGATRGILLADYLKAIMLNRDLPNDLRDQAQGSRFLGQYCPGSPGWLCRPSELDGTDLSFAFEQG